MVEKPGEAVAVIRLILLFFFCTYLFEGKAQIDSLNQFKKKVLDAVEVDVLMSYYEQEGAHAAVTEVWGMNI